MDDRDLACPRDQARLVRHDRNGITCRQCTKCSGLFVDENSLLWTLGRGRDLSAFETKAAGAVACPGCGQAMHAHVHKGIEIDICPGCRGIWMDAGEWERVVRGKKVPAGAVAAAAAAGVAAVAGVAVAQANSEPGTTQSRMGSIAEGAVDLVGEEALDGVFSFIGDAIGSLF